MIINKFLVFISLFGVVILSFMFVQGGTTGNVVDDIQKAVEGSDWCLGADVNKDGHVGIGDTAFISQYYGKTKCSNANLWCDSTDINKDKSVGIGDFNIMASYYGAYGCCARAVFGGPCVAGLSCVVELPYDDFSSGVLDGSKWEEKNFIPSFFRPFTNEHGVSLSHLGGVYHVAQNIVGDADTNLMFKKTFSKGDIVKYQVIYHSGSGNNLIQLVSGGNYLRDVPENYCPPEYNNPGCSTIGFWNGLSDVGNEIGTYNINLNF